MKLANKKILITGASSGIGRETASQLAKNNNTLIILARRINLLDELKIKYDGKECKIFTFKCDVSNKEEIREVYSETKKIIGHLNLAILNSGISYRANIEHFHSELSELVEKTFSINLMGIIYWIERLLPDFKQERNGIITVVSSLSDSRGFPKSEIYCSSKAALSIFLEGLRNELRPYNIKVLTIKPGFVRTPMTDKNDFKMPFLMDASNAAKIIIKGIEKEKRIIQFPLPTVIGAKLIKILPNFIFDYFSSRQAGIKKRK
jgi:short-subunit dehydrogenase